MSNLGQAKGTPVPSHRAGVGAGDSESVIIPKEFGRIVEWMNKHIRSLHAAGPFGAGGLFPPDYLVATQWATEVAAGRGIEGQIVYTYQKVPVELYSTVQAAVTAADAVNGAKIIFIAPGTYNEAVAIPSSSYFMTLQGSGVNNTIIGGSTKNMTIGAIEVHLQNLSLQGPTAGSCLAQLGGTSNMNVHATNVRFLRKMGGDHASSEFHDCHWSGGISFAGSDSTHNVSIFGGHVSSIGIDFSTANSANQWNVFGLRMSGGSKLILDAVTDSRFQIVFQAAGGQLDDQVLFSGSNSGGIGLEIYCSGPTNSGQVVRVVEGTKAINVQLRGALDYTATAEAATRFIRSEGTAEAWHIDVTFRQDGAGDYIEDNGGKSISGIFVKSKFTLTPTTAEVNTTAGSSGNVLDSGVLTPGSVGTGPSSVIDDVLGALNEPTGFPNRADSVLSFVSGTRTFTIGPSNGSFDYYQVGVKYTVSAPDDIIISDVSGTHFLYYDGDTLTDSVNPGEDAFDTLMVDKVLVGLVYWNATDGAAYILGDERHGTIMSGRTHEWIHDAIGAVWSSGLTVSGYTVDEPDADASLTLYLTDGEFYDQDLHHNIVDGSAANQYEQQLDGVAAAEIPVIYRDDVDGSWKEDAAAALPYKVGGSGRLAYNKDDGDGTFSQVEVTDNKFVSATLIATSDWQYPIKMVQGQAEYTDKKTAIEEATNEIIAWGTLPSPELVVLYRFVMQTKDSYGSTPNAKIVDVTDFRQSGLTGGAATAQDHGTLSGLGDDDHAHYLLADGTRVLTKLLLGAADVEIKRFAANQWGTVEDQLIQEAAGASTAVFNARVTGDAIPRVSILAGGGFFWGDGTNALDTLLYRIASNTVATGTLDAFRFQGMLNLNGGDLEKTMIDGLANASRAYITIDTEGDAGTDDLVGIWGTVGQGLPTDGDLIRIRPNNDARTVVVKHNDVGGESVNGTRVFLSDDADVSLTSERHVLCLIYDAALDSGNGAWIEVARAADIIATKAHGIAAHTEHANWKVLYTDGSGDEQEVALAADGTFFQANGAAAAPTFAALVQGDVPGHGPSEHTEFANWKIIYTDGSGDQQEIALGANGTFLESNGAAAAPAFRALEAADLTLPDHDHTGDAGDGAQIAGASALSDIGITDNKMVQVDGPGVGAPANGEYAKWTANGLEGKSTAELLSDIAAQGTAAKNAANGYAGLDANARVDPTQTAEKRISITVEDPTASEDIGITRFNVAVTITKVVGVLVGYTSVTINPKHHTDRSNAGTALLDAATAITSTTTGDVLTSWTDENLAADEFLWLETTAKTGTSGTLELTIFYTED